MAAHIKHGCSVSSFESVVVTLNIAHKISARSHVSNCHLTRQLAVVRMVGGEGEVRGGRGRYSGLDQERIGPGRWRGRWKIGGDTGHERYVENFCNMSVYV